MYRGLITLLLVASCNGGSDCAELNTSCAPLYQPTYQNVFDNTLKPTCGAPGTACHAAEGAQAGLVLDDFATARSNLLNGRVTVDDAACSPVLARLESDDRETQMPPGAKLPDGERCAIQLWIQAGAEP